MRNLIVCLLVSVILASAEETKTKEKQKRGLLLANLGENHGESYSTGLNPGYSSINGIGVNNNRVIATNIPGSFSSHGSSLTGSIGPGITGGSIPVGSPGQATGIAITPGVSRPIYIQQSYPVYVRQPAPIVENEVPVTVPVSRPILIAVRVPAHVAPDVPVHNLGASGSTGSGLNNPGHSGAGLSGYASSYSGYTSSYSGFEPTGGHGSGIGNNGPAGGRVSYTLVSIPNTGEGSGVNGVSSGLNSGYRNIPAGLGHGLNLGHGATLRSGLGSGFNLGHGSSFGANIGLGSGIQGTGANLGTSHGAHGLSSRYSYSRSLGN